MSADLPWLGLRSGLHGKQIELLKTIENPVGIKIGPKNTSEEIAELAGTLNPNNESGKLVFMLRLGIKEIENNPQTLVSLLEAIKEFAPNSIVMSDPMHGNTYDVVATDGTKRKTRALTDICDEIEAVATACRDFDMRLHGIHLEATGEEGVQQCIDTKDTPPGNRPQDISAVDPQLNTDQAHTVINHFARLTHDIRLMA